MNITMKLDFTQKPTSLLFLLINIGLVELLLHLNASYLSLVYNWSNVFGGSRTTPEDWAYLLFRSYKGE